MRTASAVAAGFTIPTVGVVKPIDTHVKRGVTNRTARIRRLRERLETETDPRIRAAIAAQLAALDRNWRDERP